MLITEGDNVGVIAMVRGLERGGYDPWLTVARRNAPAALSRSVAGVVKIPDPAVSEAGFVSGVVNAAAEIRPVAILPGGEKGMLALSGQTALPLPEGATLALCARDTVHRATDKRAIAVLARQVGLDVPETYALSADEAARGAFPSTLPAIVKCARSETPTNGGFQSSKTRRVATREQAIAALERLPGRRGLIQPHSPGSLFSLAGVFWDGEIVAAVQQKAVRIWPVGAGQMAYAVSVAPDRAFAGRIAKLLRVLGWHGMFQIQFLETDERRLLIDLNPRVYGSLSLALAAGRNLPTVWADLVTGRTVAPSDYVPGVSFRNEMLDSFALVAAARHARSGALARQLAAPASSHAYFEPRDVMPLLALGPTAVAKVRARIRLQSQR